MADFIPGNTDTRDLVALVESGTQHAASELLMRIGQLERSEEQSRNLSGRHHIRLSNLIYGLRVITAGTRKTCAVADVRALISEATSG